MYLLMREMQASLLHSFLENVFFPFKIRSRNAGVLPLVRVQVFEEFGDSSNLGVVISGEQIVLLAYVFFPSGLCHMYCRCRSCPLALEWSGRGRCRQSVLLSFWKAICFTGLLLNSYSLSLCLSLCVCLSLLCNTKGTNFWILV